MARTISTAALLVWSSVFLFATAVQAGDDTTIKTDAMTASVLRLTTEEFSARSRKILHRVPHCVRIYSNRLGPNAVRVCNAQYVQEYRPSGTVIVPRMNCYWRG